MKLGTGEQRGCDMSLPLGELAFGEPSLAQSLEGRHNRASPHTSAGSSHSKGVGEQTVHKKGGLVSYLAWAGNAAWVSWSIGKSQAGQEQ